MKAILVSASFIAAMSVAGAVNAQPEAAGEEGTIAEQNVEEPASSSEPASEAPALQLKLDAAGLDVAASGPRTADGYTLEEMDVRVRRARIGLGVSLIAMSGGLAMVGIAGSLSPLGSR